MTQGYEQGSYGQGSYGQGTYGQGSYEQGSGSSEPAPAPAGPRRARVGLIALVAFLVELIIIAAGANQAVSKHLVSYLDDHNPNSFVSSMVRAGLVFSWRLTPQHGDNQHGVHTWLSQIVGDVGIFVLTVLLILAIARGPITWGRAFFGIWMTVVVSTCLAAIPALLVTRNFAQPGVDKATYAVFSGPNAYEFFAGTALGLVVGLITSIVAIATRRSGAPAAVVVADETARTVPEPPPPYYGDTAPTGWSQPSSNQPLSNQPPSNQPAQSARSESPTTAYPVVAPGPPAGGPAPSEPTTALPRFDGGWQPGQRSGEPAPNQSVTSEFPKSEAPKSEFPKSEAPSVDAAPLNAPQEAGDRTTTLPRFAGGETGTWPPQPPAAPSQTAPSQTAPSAPSGDEPTAAFPLPPDDEDLGQHPDHD